MISMELHYWFRDFVRSWNQPSDFFHKDKQNNHLDLTKHLIHNHNVVKVKRYVHSYKLCQKKKNETVVYMTFRLKDFVQQMNSEVNSGLHLHHRLNFIFVKPAPWADSTDACTLVISLSASLETLSITLLICMWHTLRLEHWSLNCEY